MLVKMKVWGKVFEVEVLANAVRRRGVLMVGRAVYMRAGSKGWFWEGPMRASVPAGL